VEAVAVRLGERVEKVQADIRGPVAAALLDFLYTGMMSTLNVGCVRFGLMLRENAPVVDDGTCARRGPAFPCHHHHGSGRAGYAAHGVHAPGAAA